MNTSSASYIPTYCVDFYQGKQHCYAVVVPVINEGERIIKLIERMYSLDLPSYVDILIVDGGSTDGSLNHGNLKSHNIKGLITKTSPGKLSVQLLCGYDFCLHQGYTGIITIDGNNKDDPSTIPNFIRLLDKGYDFVQASRYIPGGYEENTPLLRKIAIQLVHSPLLSLSSGFRWTDTTQGYRAYSSKLLLDPRVDPFRKIFFTYELLAYLSYRAPKLGYLCIETPTSRSYPDSGKIPTKINFLGNFTLLKILLKACLGYYNP